MLDIESPKWKKNSFVLVFFAVVIGIVFCLFYDDSVIIDGHRYEHGAGRDRIEKYWHSPDCECKL